MDKGVQKKSILFLCTGNSCRSQMAEGWARHLWPQRLDSYSAGTDPHGVNPLAVQVMAESGVDISTHQSQHIDEFQGLSLDVVVTVCNAANESCPVLPEGVRHIHQSFDDPPALAKQCKTEEEALGHYARVRDEIRKFVETMPEILVCD